MLFIILGIIIFIFIIYKTVVAPPRYWNKLGIPRRDWFHLFYCNWLIMFKPQSVAYMIQQLYEGVPNSSFHGLHQFNKPSIILKHPDIIKQIAIKGFDHFSDRSFKFVDDPLFGKNLLSLSGQAWRDTRAVLSPSFTTNKLKVLFQTMDTCGKRFVQYFVDKNEDLIEAEMQDMFTRYTCDVIGNGVFGTEVDSLKDPNNAFYLNAKHATDLTKFPANLKLMINLISPTLFKTLGIQLLSNETMSFFKNLIDDSIRLREEGKIVQKDMIQLLMDAKHESDIQEQKAAQGGEKTTTTTRITYQDIMSQSFIFFFAGFESVSRAMCFVAHELAVNQDVQEKLRAEVEEANSKCDGKLTYEIITGMKYMDMVISETLRKYPTQIATDRVCTKPYVVQPVLEGEKPVEIPVGTAVIIPTISLHHDENFFPNPEKFDPERFSDENKANMLPYAYQPFGLGPRNCIGLRFALLEVKLVFFHLLGKFEIVPVKKTKIPLVLKKTLMSLTSEYGFWVGLKRI